MQLQTEWKYRILLLTLLVSLALFPFLNSASVVRLLLHLIYSLVFIAALLVIFPTHRLRVIAALLGIPTLVGLWTGYVLPDVARLPAVVAFHLLAAMFFAFTIGVILRNLHSEKGVSADGVCGAFCGYLLVAVLFGHVFNVIEALEPGSFRGEVFTHEMSGDRRHFLLTYFSFITLTTVGYGDITPGSDPVRGLVAVEAIVGQFYIAVLVAELIGKRVSFTTAQPQPDAAPSVPPANLPKSPPPAV